MHSNFADTDVEKRNWKHGVMRTWHETIQEKLPFILKFKDNP